ncbi:MAG: class I SAM-dependent methyltransferase, partial [Planctomycetes bacterium]|nr:class I SAM-dependent methyltransferase [Planctomycetota bacterium]
RVADVACGTGMHAVALAEKGLMVSAIDPDSELLAAAGRRANERSVAIDLKEASFDMLPGDWAGRFDAALCLGNSLSLVEPGQPLENALLGIAGLLRPGGTAIVHTLNYPMLARRKDDPWGPVRVLDDRSLLLKGFLPRTDGPWEVLLIHLERSGEGNWHRYPARFQIHPHEPNKIRKAAQAAGLSLKTIFGGFKDESPEDFSSSDLLYSLIRNPH